MTDTEKAALERRIDELCADVERLRQERREYQATIDSLVDECTDHKDENAKLRELVRALLTCATDGECDECRMNGATPWHVGEAQLCDGVWEHLRELGIEVYE